MNICIIQNAQFRISSAVPATIKKGVDYNQAIDNYIFSIIETSNLVHE